jgi:hypothetical protein
MVSSVSIRTESSFIGAAAKLERAAALVFMRGSWSSCPAEQWVPAMLEGVWL